MRQTNFPRQTDENGFNVVGPAAHVNLFRREKVEPQPSPTSLLGYIFVVDLTKTAGSAGDKTTACTFVYTAKDLNGSTVGTGLAPLNSRARILLAPVTQGTVGSCYYDLNGTAHLLDCNETIAQNNCT